MKPDTHHKTIRLPEYGINAEIAYPAPVRENYATGAEYAEACRCVYHLRVNHRNLQRYPQKRLPPECKPSLLQRIKNWLKGLVF